MAEFLLDGKEGTRRNKAKLVNQCDEMTCSLSEL